MHKTRKDEIMGNRNRINQAQRIAARAYGDGDYKHITEKTDWVRLRATLKTCGDTVFQGVMIELANAEDCNTLQEALRRCNQIIEDVTKVRNALEDELNRIAKNKLAKYCTQQIIDN
jgi:propanediol dehydratase small subunit